MRIDVNGNKPTAVVGPSTAGSSFANRSSSANRLFFKQGKFANVATIA